MTIEKMNQKYTWQAMITVMEAIIDFSHRYADLAEKMASECKDEKRRRQLLTMAENCRLVPENPPETLKNSTIVLNHATHGTFQTIRLTVLGRSRLPAGHPAL